MRNRATKVFLGVIAIVMLAVVAIALALPVLVSTDAIRIRLAQDLSAWTGYNVQLRDAPHLDLFPYPQASLSGITLTPMADDAAPLMEAERIVVDLSLLDALLGRISFSQTRIIHPHIVMEEPVKTVADFFETISRSEGSFGSAVREAREIVATNPDNPDTTRLLNQPFGRIVIEDGQLLYRKTVGGKSEKITALNATLEWPETIRAASFRANAYWHGQLSELRIDTDQALLFLSGGKSPIRASFNSRRGGVTFEGQGKLAENYFFDGRLSARSPGWNQTLDWLGYRQVLGQGLKIPVVWESGFLAQPGHIQLNNVLFKLGDESARGALEGSYIEDQPVTTGSLAFDSLDLNTIVAAFFPDEEKNENLDLSILDKIGLDIRMSAPEATLGNVQLSNLAAAIQIRNGRGIFDLGNANAFDGSVQCNIQITRNKENANIEGRVSGTSVSVSALTESLGQPSIIDAKAGFILTFHAPFTRWSEVAKKMDGQLTLNMSSGHFKGYNVDDLRNALNKEATSSITRSDNLSTAFDRWDIQANTTNGTITVNKSDMRFRSWVFSAKGDAKLQTELANTNGYIISLQSTLEKNSRSDSICNDVTCLKNSLQYPFRFSIAANNFPYGDIKVSRQDYDNWLH